MAIEAALFGTLGKEAEAKTSKNGKAYLRLNVACGEGEGTTWVSAMVFDDRAIALAERFTKGARVYLEGKLSLNEWTANDGTTRTGLSVMSWHCRLFSRVFAAVSAYDVEYWKNRAEEARQLAETMQDAHTKILMLDVAESYEEIAKSYEKVAQWMKRSRGPELPPESVT